MMAARAGGLAKPVRWFSIPQLFPLRTAAARAPPGTLPAQHGHRRETDPLADAEIIAAGIDALRELGLGSADIVVRISDRRLVGALLGAHGIGEVDHVAVFGALDRLEKEGEEGARARLAAAGVEATQATGLLEAMRLPRTRSRRRTRGTGRSRRRPGGFPSCSATARGGVRRIPSLRCRSRPGVGLLHGDRVRDLGPQG